MVRHKIILMPEEFYTLDNVEVNNDEDDLNNDNVDFMDEEGDKNSNAEDSQQKEFSHDDDPFLKKTLLEHFKAKIALGEDFSKYAEKLPENPQEIVKVLEEVKTKIDTKFSVEPKQLYENFPFEVAQAYNFLSSHTLRLFGALPPLEKDHKELLCCAMQVLLDFYESGDLAELTNKPGDFWQSTYMFNSFIDDSKEAPSFQCIKDFSKFLPKNEFRLNSLKGLNGFQLGRMIYARITELMITLCTYTKTSFQTAVREKLKSKFANSLNIILTFSIDLLVNMPSISLELKHFLFFHLTKISLKHFKIKGKLGQSPTYPYMTNEERKQLTKLRGLGYGQRVGEGSPMKCLQEINDLLEELYYKADKTQYDPETLLSHFFTASQVEVFYSLMNWREIFYDRILIKNEKNPLLNEYDRNWILYHIKLLKGTLRLIPSIIASHVPIKSSLNEKISITNGELFSKMPILISFKQLEKSKAYKLEQFTAKFTDCFFETNKVTPVMAKKYIGAHRDPNSNKAKAWSLYQKSIQRVNLNRLNSQPPKRYLVSSLDKILDELLDLSRDIQRIQKELPIEKASYFDIITLSGAGDDVFGTYPIGCTNQEIMVIIKELNERMSKIEADNKWTVLNASGQEKSLKYVQNLKNQFLLPLDQSKTSSKTSSRKVIRYHLKTVSELIQRMEDLENI